MADKRRGNKRKTVVKLPKGTIFTEASNKTEWQLTEPIGEGGFGVIYGAKKKTPVDDGSYVVKVEPHENGPLFVERNYFMKNLKSSMLDTYKSKEKLQFLGLPTHLGSGTHDDKEGVKYRFLVMERFGDNINKSLLSKTGIDFKKMVQYCSQITDSLKYVHTTGYAHLDIKPENLLLKYGGTDDHVYLIDFGIVDKYTDQKVFKPDKKKQHNGTALYTSRDSHQGVATMRGDFEILGYNILQWCGIELPWAKDIKNANLVFEKKQEFIDNLSKLKGKIPDPILEYFDYVTNLRHDETPNYELIKKIFGKLLCVNSTSKSSKTTVKVKTPNKKTVSNGTLNGSPPIIRRKAAMRQNYADISSDDGELSPSSVIMTKSKAPSKTLAISSEPVIKRGRGRPKKNP